MKIFSGEQIRLIDRYTIENEPVKSIDLMERATHMLLEWVMRRFERPAHFLIFVGPGNNGGDGLALARLLKKNQYDVEIHYVSFTGKVSEDWTINFERIKIKKNIQFNKITSEEEFPAICSNDIIVDAIFGSGLTKPADGLAGEVIRKINRSGNQVISVDIPSGLFTGDNSYNNPENIIRADHTLSFQFPKLSFLFAENHNYTGEWHILPIGLHPVILNETYTPYSLIDASIIYPFFKVRNKFDHKGVFGHGLLIAGSKGKFGAAILSGKAALRTGIGLITSHIPSSGVTAVHSSVAEIMVNEDKNNDIVTTLPDLIGYDAVGIGPGIGTDNATVKVLDSLFSECDKPLVIDADGINILGLRKDLLSSLPAGAILTPHPKEFERIAGPTTDGYLRLLSQIAFSEKYNCIIVLKGAHTSVSLPDGRVYFNNNGNPGMATAGTGDVLTGMILSLLAQGYSPEKAAITGVFLHGLAGDIAAQKFGYEALIASDIIDNIGNAYNFIRNNTY
jgi:NAD(P)H-hydrate epimerase